MVKPMKVLMIADLHIGVNDAPAPYMDNIHVPTTIQHQLNNWWDVMCEDSYDVVIVVGDVVDGIDRKGSGRDNWTTNVEVQCEAAAILLSKIKTKQYWMVRGTAYHVGDNPDYEKLVAQKIQTKTKRTTVFEDAMIGTVKVGPKPWRIQFSHKVGITGSKSRQGTSIMAQLEAAMLENEAFGGIDIILRGHGHRFYCGGITHNYNLKYGLMLPGWKLTDGYVRVNMPLSIPDLGWVVGTFYEDRVDFAYKPIPIKHRLKEVIYTR